MAGILAERLTDIYAAIQTWKVEFAGLLPGYDVHLIRIHVEHTELEQAYFYGAAMLTVADTTRVEH